MYEGLPNTLVIFEYKSYIAVLIAKIRSLSTFLRIIQDVDHDDY